MDFVKQKVKKLQIEFDKIRNKLFKPLEKDSRKIIKRRLSI